MHQLITSFTIGFLIVSCTSKKGQDNYDSSTSEQSKKEFYLNKMKEKNFQLINNGPCDDALQDTIHKRSFAYFDSKILTDTNSIIEFKFIDACCQEFLGDYSILNDTLIFKFEQVNDKSCLCLCWYRYKLTINGSQETFKGIKIEEK